jgi:hypothetical protein
MLESPSPLVSLDDDGARDAPWPGRFGARSACPLFLVFAVPSYLHLKFAGFLRTLI